MLNVDIDLVANLQRVQEQIAEAAMRAGRQPSEITLIGISKTQPAEMVAELVRAGLHEVGENRVQEAADKFPRLRELLAGVDMPVRHMVGHLQSNKAGAASEVFDRIDTIDSLKVARALARHAAARRSVLPALIEVYVGEDAARPGVRPDQAVDVIGEILELEWLRVEGLMTVAPLGARARDAFAQVRGLKQTVSEAFPAVHFGVLSMGMSEDFHEAIAEGSTQVRVGTALFGPRRSRF